MRKWPDKWLRPLVAVAVVISTAAVSGATATSAAADTPYTLVHETFDGTTFPPANWTTAQGSWSQVCNPAPTPAAGCSAMATVTDPTAGPTSQLNWDPGSPIPADLQNPVLTYYSDFNAPATTAGDGVGVWQAVQEGVDHGDLYGVEQLSVGGSNDPYDTQVLHTVPLTHLTLPLIFKWTSFGDSAATTNKTWKISDVTISGTVAGASYTLTANPIPNTTYPHVLGGQPVTLTLSGSSNPTGDSMTFAVASAPSHGTLGPVTAIDGTSAHVTYTPDPCPDPRGTANFLCVDTFTYTASDLAGNTSQPAQVTLDVHPEGAGGATPTVTAPAKAAYTTIVDNGTPTQAADLSGLVSVGPSTYPDAVELDLQVPTGQIRLSDLPVSGATLLNGTASPGSQIDLFGSVAQLNIAVQQLLYLPPAGTTPTTTLSLFTKDTGPTGSGPYTQGQSATTEISATVVTPPPTISLPTGTLSVANNNGPLTFPPGASTGISVADGGATATTQDTVLLSVSNGTIAIPAADASGATPLVTAPQTSGPSLQLTGTVANLNTALADLTFDPSNLGSGTVTLTAQVQNPDSGLASAQRQVSITVVAAPFAFGTTAVSVRADTSATFALCASGPPGDALSFNVTGAPAHGTFVALPNADTSGSGCSQNSSSFLEMFTYTPATGYVGADSVSYTVHDATTGLDSALNTVAITVQAHTTPVAEGASANTQQDTPVDIVVCATNPDPSPALQFLVATNPANGTVSDGGTPAVDTCNSPAATPHVLTYTPTTGAFTSSGIDSFTYVATNGAQSLPATVTINVATRTPHALDESRTVDENSSLGFLLCSTSPNTGNVGFLIHDDPLHGTLDTNAAATNVNLSCPTGQFGSYIRYVPTYLYSGPDSFTYTTSYLADNGHTYTSAPATVTMTVNKIEIPPTVTGQTVTDITPHPVAITLTGSSLQGSALTYRVVQQPTRGTLSGTAPNLVYTPTSSRGTDFFTFVANDGVADSEPATVVINLVMPSVTSTVCVPGTTPIALDQYPCASQLQAVTDASGHVIELGHTSGARVTQSDFQVTITNASPIADTVTLTAPAISGDWNVLYDWDGMDVTSQVTGAGIAVPLAANASTYLRVVVFPPLNQPTPPTVSIPVVATSGNDSTVTSTLPLVVQNGKSAPALHLAQADGTGVTTFPNTLSLTPALYGDGPGGTIVLGNGLIGTGVNTFAVHAEIRGSTQGVGVRYILGTSNDVTAAVTAGTQVITCYADIGCPPMKVVLTPAAADGSFLIDFTETSTIDGQSAVATASVSFSRTAGPDLSTNLPNVGIDVLETTPSTQAVSVPLQANGTVSKTLFVLNTASVPDSVLLTVAHASPTDPGTTVAVTDLPAGTVNKGPGSWLVPLAAGDDLRLHVVATSTGAAGTAPTPFIVTAVSTLAPAHSDAFSLSFPTYNYAPSLTANGSTSEVDLDQTPRSIPLSLSEHNTGVAPAGDAVVVTADAGTAAYPITYSLTDASGTRDVTWAVTGVGLPVTLLPNGAPAQTLTVIASATSAAPLGALHNVTVRVRSTSSLPAGASSSVVLGLANMGNSQLEFVGRPQAEPTDITSTVRSLNDTDRVPPITVDSPHAGNVYGANGDPAGNKFVYASAWDQFTMRVAANRVIPTAYRVVVSAPAPGSGQWTPLWAREAFTLPYYNGTLLEQAGNPLGSGGPHPTFTVGGQDVTAAVEAGTYTTATLHPGQSLDFNLTFAPPAGASTRYSPMRIALVNTVTGATEDVFSVDLSTILSCSDDSSAQTLATATLPSGRTGHLAFEPWDRTDPSAAGNCMQHLSTGWVTKNPVVFGDYVPASGTMPAGGESPNGLWVVPQLGNVVRIDAKTLEVTSPRAKVYVDTPFLDNNGLVDPNTAGALGYDFVGDYPDFDWKTQDATNGLRVQDGGLPGSPFPLIRPESAYWPNNTMAPARYFQVNTVTGQPLMVGEMAVNTPWYHANVPLLMPVSTVSGLSLQYAPPPDVTASLPGDDSVTSYGLFWTTRHDGTVIQGGCLGLPPAFFNLLGLQKSVCLLEVTTTYAPIPSDPAQTATIRNVTFGLKVVGVTVGTPEFNLHGLDGHVDFVPGTSTVQEVVTHANFGVGPPTPCQLEQDARAAAKIAETTAQKIESAACPSNYFFFDATITFKQGGFTSANSTTGYGIKFDGTLSLLNVINLSNVEADISTNPFNFHFADSPVAVSVNVGVPLAANITLSGDVGALGFDIGLSGSLSVDGEPIATASGILSTKGMGLCAGVAGVSMGLGEVWGSAPTFYPSGCTTTQYQVA